jgi:hypothetical protein
MGFGAGALLPFVALAAIPLLIHILSRLRLQRAQFPSLLLLENVRRERFSWLRLKELLLLILRTLALLALLLALTRPFIRLRLPGLGRAGDVVVVLDDSYSMRYGSRWLRATAALRGLLAGMGTGQRAVLLRSSDRAAVRDWEKPDWILRRVDSLAPTWTAAVLEPSLRRATALARERGAEVVVVTDLQARALPDTLQPRAGTRVVLIDVGDDRAENAGITGVATVDRFPLAGRPVRMKAELANRSRAAATRTAVLALGTRREEKVVALPGQARQPVEFELAYSDTAPVAARFELRSDSLAADDGRWLAVTLLARVRVLVVQSAAVPARYVIDALGQDSLARFALTVVSSAELGRTDLQRFGVAVITDAAALSRADWTRLAFHIQSGGAALLMAGAAPEDSNAGQGLVRFLGTARPAGFVSAAFVDTTHPALDVLGRQGLAQARFYSHARLAAGAGRVLAGLVDGDPLVVEPGGGRLMVWAFAPVPEQTDLVYKAAFVPFLHRSLVYLAGSQTRTDYLVGDTVRMMLDSGGAVAIDGPDRKYLVQPVATRGRPELVFAGTDEPGCYRVGQRLFAVNVDADEGELERADPGRLARLGYEVRRTGTGQDSDLTQLLLFLAAGAFALELLLLL